MNPSPSPAGPILVALGSGPEALRLLYAAFRLARERALPWVAVHIEVAADEGPEESEMARQWLQEAQDLGARSVWFRAPTVALGLVEVAQNEGASLFMAGKSRRTWPWERLGHQVVHEVSRRLPELSFLVLDTEHDTEPLPSRPVADLTGTTVAALAILAACTGAAAILPLPNVLAAALLTFLPGVAFISYRWKRTAGLMAILGSSALFTFFIVPPRFSFQVTSVPDLLVFVLLLFGTQRVMDLVKRLRRQTREMRRRQAQATALFLFGRALSRCSRLEEVGEETRRHFRRLFQIETGILFGDSVEQPSPFCSAPPPLFALPKGFANKIETNSPPTDPLRPWRAEGRLFLPLWGSEGTSGYLRFDEAAQKVLGPEAWDLVQAMAVQTALAVERLRWLDLAQKAQVEREAERTRNALLSAISHDLRTPLAAIQGAASSLLLSSEMTASTRRDLLTMIQEESQHLAQVLTNLLELTRLESGTLLVQKEWQPLEEVVGAALRRTELKDSLDRVNIDLPFDLPLVPLDGALFEQVLLNLLHNALRQAPSVSVELKAWQEENTVYLEVADRGPGIPPEWRERIFEKFARLPGEPGEGLGLGLAISRAIVTAHGGRIWVEERLGGGSRFCITLPVGGMQPDNPLSEDIPS